MRLELTEVALDVRTQIEEMERARGASLRVSSPGGPDGKLARRPQPRSREEPAQYEGAPLRELLAFPPGHGVTVAGAGGHEPCLVDESQQLRVTSSPHSMGASSSRDLLEDDVRGAVGTTGLTPVTA